MTLAVVLTATARAQEVKPLIVIHSRGRLFLGPARHEPFRGRDGHDQIHADQWFDQADTNHDGVLTLDEFLADHMRFFKVLDRDDKGDVDGFDVARYDHDIRA